MKYVRSLVIVLVLVVILLLILAVSGKYAEAPTVDTQPATGGNAMPVPDDTSPPSTADTITYSFEYDLPTPCHSLPDPDVIIRESYPVQIGVAYTVTEPAPGTMCTQVIKHITVTETIQVPEKAILTSVTVNGKLVVFSVIK